MNKAIHFLNIVILCLAIPVSFLSCSENYNEKYISADEMKAVILEALPTEIGYCEADPNYFEHFKDIDGIIGYQIFKSNDSTNFDEIGILKFEDSEDAEDAKKDVKEYLKTAKERFEGGIIYNIDEYPKFKNANVKRYGNLLLYTILSDNDTQSIYSSIKERG